MMTDPFRAELTMRYVEAENLAWAARERLVRSVRPRPAGGGLLRRLAAIFSREVPARRGAEIEVLPRRQRPAA